MNEKNEPFSRVSVPLKNLFAYFSIYLHTFKDNSQKLKRIIMPVKREWMCRNGSEEHQSESQINDPIHGYITICHPIKLIFDTPEFQRLRYIAQLGFVFKVYPSADHNRFCHSLGVYKFAMEMVSHLMKVRPEFGITKCDQLCVCIAALIHDLGHGPFSHTYEAQFLKPKGIHFEHEQMSWEMFYYMLNKNDGKLKAELDEYLDGVDYQFIKELINPPKDCLKNPIWTLKGRPREKAFLYEIVSNPNTGLDVDKIDYLLRDSHCSNVSISLNMSSAARILDNVQIGIDPYGDYKYNTLIYPGKITDTLSDVFKCRREMYEKVYRHKTVVAVELMYVKAFNLADPFLEFVGQDGQKYTMSNAHQCPKAFSQLDDTITRTISSSTDPRLSEAKSILEDIEYRRLPKFLGKFKLNSEAAKNRSQLERQIQSNLKDRMPAEAKDVEIIVKIQSFDYGQKIDPIKSLIRYHNKDPNDVLKKSNLPTFISSSHFLPASDLFAFCYLQYEQKHKRELATRAFLQLVEDQPSYVCNGRENQQRNSKRPHPSSEDEMDEENGDNEIIGRTKKLKTVT